MRGGAPNTGPMVYGVKSVWTHLAARCAWGVHTAQGNRHEPGGSTLLGLLQQAGIGRTFVSVGLRLMRNASAISGP